MKSHVFIIFFLLNAAIRIQGQTDTLDFIAEPINDTVEYELLVLDPGFESFLALQPHMEFYSLAYYENWNTLYVMEWNARFMQPLVNGDLYEEYINYSREIDYGLELNYRLYYFFRFFEKENEIDLLPWKIH